MRHGGVEVEGKRNGSGMLSHVLEMHMAAHKPSKARAFLHLTFPLILLKPNTRWAPAKRFFQETDS